MGQNSLIVPRGNPGPESWATPVPWASSTPYVATAPRSVVTYLGATYVCLASNTGVTPDSDFNTWQVIAARGAVGPTGLTGLTGPIGPAGPGGGTTTRGLWSASATYAAGETVSYLGDIYQASAATGPSATFPSASFTKLTLSIPATPPTRPGLVLASNSTTAGDIAYSPVVSAVAGAWTSLTLTNGSTPANLQAPQYRVIGDRVEFRGYISGLSGSQVALFTLPAGARVPVAAAVPVIVTSDASAAQVQFTTDGVATVYFGAAKSSVTMTLGGAGYSLTADTGQPAYSSTFLTTQPTAWTAIPLGSGITTSTSNPAQYRFNGDRIELRGVLNGASATASNLSQTLGTMPVGARPYTDVLAVGFNAATVAPVGVNISGAGIVQTYNASAISNGQILLGGIDYSVSTTSTLSPTGAVGSAWTPLTITSGAANSTIVPSYRIVGDEVQLRGVVDSLALSTSPPVFATLPVGFRPPQQRLLPAMTANGNPVGVLIPSSGALSGYVTGSLSGQSLYLDGARFSITA